MAGKADGYELDVLRAATGQATSIIASTPLAAVYLALFTSDPTDSGLAGNEATGGGYARVNTVGKWAAPSNGSVSNNADIAFAQFTGSVSTAAPFTHFALLKSLSTRTATDVLYVGALTDQTKTGANGDTIVFSTGSIVITED